MRKLIVLAATLVALAFAAPATAQAANYASTPWTTAGNAIRHDGSGGIISCQNIAQINSLDVFHLRSAAYVSCNSGPGGSDWRDSISTLLWGEQYDLFTVVANLGLSGGTKIANCGRPDGWLCKGETWTANQPGNTPDPYWWSKQHYALVLPSNFEWGYAGAGCTISDSFNNHHGTLTCELSTPMVTHH